MDKFPNDFVAQAAPDRLVNEWQNRVAKGQEKHQHVVFRYKAGWGPQTKMNTSRYYPTKEIAARAIHQWAGDDWANRVITKHQSLVHLQIGEEPEAVQEARITSMVRNLRCNSVSWLQKTVTPELVKEDETRQSLRFVEDDRLEKQLEELADKNCLPEEWQDALSQALKCETDKWEGWVVYLGPLAPAAICQVYGISVEAYKLEELEELGSFPPCIQWCALCTLLAKGLAWPIYVAPMDRPGRVVFCWKIWKGGGKVGLQSRCDQQGCRGLPSTWGTGPFGNASKQEGWWACSTGGGCGNGRSGAIAIRGPLEDWFRVLGAGIDSPTAVQAYFTGHTRQCTTCSTNSTVDIEQYILHWNLYGTHCRASAIQTLGAKFANLGKKCY